MDSINLTFVPTSSVVAAQPTQATQSAQPAPTGISQAPGLTESSFSSSLRIQPTRTDVIDMLSGLLPADALQAIFEDQTCEGVSVGCASSTGLAKPVQTHHVEAILKLLEQRASEGGLNNFISQSALVHLWVHVACNLDLQAPGAQTALSCLESLVFQGDDLFICINALDKHGFSPLYHAIRYGSIEATNFLLEKNASSTMMDTQGSTMLHVAAKLGSTEFMSCLFQKMQSFEWECLISQPDLEGRLPLYYAQLPAWINSSVSCPSFVSDSERAALPSFMIEKGAQLTDPNAMGV